jgi:SAM-dependent methyltransferase
VTTNVPACPACGSVASDRIYAGLLKCRGCTHVWADVEVDWATVRGIYQRSYFFGDEYANYLEDRRVIEKNFFRRLASLRRFLGPSHRRLFEIGCAYGFFLNAARASFESVAGIDISEDAVRHATQELGLSAECGDLLTADLSGRSFDVVCMWDTIEHLAEPRRYVETAADHMVPGALMAVTTGDVGSLVARVQKGRWRLIHPPTHLQYFTRTSLSRLLEASGFRVRHVEYCGFHRSVSGMLHNLAALRWNRPRLAAWLGAVTPAGFDLYLNLHDIMYFIAERR